MKKILAEKKKDINLMYNTTNEYNDHRRKLVNAIIVPPEEFELAF